MNGTNLKPAVVDGTERPQIAIIGSGPSGCYAAMSIRKTLPTSIITFFESRPTPFGLLRYGVAADHQGTKGVERQFDRLFSSADVAFVGNTKVGRDVSLAEIESAFHATVLATGLSLDNQLRVPVASESQVFGASELLLYLNGDPDSTLRANNPNSIGQELVVIGTGNVALDVVRLLAKSDADLEGSDIDDSAREKLDVGNIKQIRILGRCTEDNARWDASMLAELKALPNANVSTDEPETDPADDGDERIRITISFDRDLESIEHNGLRTVVHARSVDGQSYSYSADTVISAIGFAADPELWCGTGAEVLGRTHSAGGCGSGKLGTLAENRRLTKLIGVQVKEHINFVEPRPGLQGILGSLPSMITNYDDWLAIEQAERERAHSSRCRAKFTSRGEINNFLKQRNNPTDDQNRVLVPHLFNERKES